MKELQQQSEFGQQLGTVSPLHHRVPLPPPLLPQGPLGQLVLHITALTQAAGIRRDTPPTPHPLHSSSSCADGWTELARFWTAHIPASG